MISLQKSKSFCSEDISNIENYEQAVNDKTQLWHCHHRRETIFSAKELIEINEYYHRPAAELIFMKAHDHLSMHKKENKNFSFLGKQHSKEYKDKMSKMHSGQGNPFYGKHHSKSTKKKISKSGKGRKHSDETKAKMSTAHKGNIATKYRHWYNDGIKCVMAYDCPEGFKKGRL